MLKHPKPPRNRALFGALLGANLLSWFWAAAAFHGHPALLGTALLAWVLGLRHAVDADHIAAIDNVVRKLMQAGARPDAVGFWFSLGHSTVVVLACLAVSAAVVTVPGLLGLAQNLGSVAGTLISAIFLITIAAANCFALRGVWRALRRDGRNPAHNSPDFDTALGGGLLTRILRPALRVITQSWQIYPLGFLFGLGFDTATEVALLTSTALLASEHIPWEAIISLPILFTAGMTVMDTSDGIFMNLAYGWAFFNPVRKVFYNLAITGLSVAICFFIGGIETLSLIPLEVHGVSQTSGFWGFMYNFNINTAGFVIVGMFILTWAAAILIWRYAHIEERWTARLQGVGGTETPLSPPWAEGPE